MVESITASVSSDSSAVNRPSEIASRSHFSRDGSSAFSDRGEHVNSWKRDILDNVNTRAFVPQDQDDGQPSPRQDASVGGRAFSRKEFYGGPGLLPPRPYIKGGIPDPQVDDFSQQFRSQRWNISGDGDYFGRNSEIESEFQENFAERFADSAWGNARTRGKPDPQYHDRMYQHYEADSLYSFGRSRYPMRQPRVLPPPSIASLHRNPYRGENERSGPSTFPESEMQSNHGARNDSTMQARYDSSYQENLGTSETIAQLENTEIEVQKLNTNTTRCDSQSSLSVSSPPDSPVHLSNDDLDESGDSPVLLAGEGKDVALLGQENESVSLPTETNKENVMSGSSIVSDGEDGEWAVENGEQLQLQEQEEYDEDEDGYEEEDEVHDGEDENINLTQNLEDMHLDEECAPDMMESLVLGFNEGVEVGMPNDDFERSSGNEEIKFVIPKPSEEQGSFDATCSYGQTLQHVDGSTLVNLDNSTRIFQETQKAIQAKNSSQTSALPEHMDHSDASTNHCLSIQPQIQLSSDQTAMSTIPSASNQPEVPVKLQFGLFSGPSLIPSPVPAIQIGSIQMPLHLHPPSGTILHSYPPITASSLSVCNVSSNHSIGVAVPIKPGQDIVKNDVSSVSMDNQRGLLPRHLDLSHLEVKEGNLLPLRYRADNTKKIHKVKGDCSHSGNINSRPESCFQAENSLVKTFKTVPTRELEHQPQTGEASSLSVSKEKGLGVSKGPGLISSGRGRRYVFLAKHSGPGSSFQATEISRTDSSGFQRKPRRLRTEFRVQGKFGIRSNLLDQRHPKHIPDSEGSSSRPVSLQEIDSRSKVEKVAGKESVRKIQNISHSREDVDAPLQSGIVRVFEQPGIEAPSDDDDFIEVRSKRQMLNDRREQRQKEIKAKSQVSKMPRKPRPYSQSASVSSISNKNYPPVGGEASNSIRSDFVVPEGHGLSNIEVSAGFNAPIVSQPLPPIGTPAVKTEIQAVKSFHTSSLTSVSGGGKNHASGLIFDGKNNVLETVQTSLGSWGRSRINQQHLCRVLPHLSSSPQNQCYFFPPKEDGKEVMTLAQTQLDEAMKPVQFDSHSSVGDPTNSVSEPSLPSSSLLCKDKSFSSAGSPINSLLAGEKIQFGAVTSPILPSNRQAVSHGIGPPSLCQSDIHISHNLSAAESDCSLFFEKEKPSNETCAHLEDCEAEAAASAVAVAAISSDEIGGNVLGAGHVSVSDSKNFGGADLDSISAGASADQQIASQSRVEESLSLALPADLSVDTPISLWPPLPIPQNSESQMLSHVSGAPPQFPFYEMNPMLGGPIFAFGPHDESTPTQSQSQKSNASVSGPLGAWQQHSAVDSFYGPPAVGQFGQVGLSYMGSTYIPSGKQPDWKHNHVSSAMSGEGDMNMVSSQRNPTNMPAIQHLAPGSPLLPLASPVAMYDVSPFQSSDISVQARWPHVPASPLQSLPVSKPLQQAEVPPSHFNHSLPVDQTLTATRFSESGTATPDNRQDFPAATYATVSQLPDELRLVDSITTSVGISTQSIGAKSSSASTISEAGKIDVMQNDRASSGSGQNSSSALKTKPSHQKNTSAQHYNNSAGYNYQRGGGGSQKNSSSGMVSSENGIPRKESNYGYREELPPFKNKADLCSKTDCNRDTNVMRSTEADFPGFYMLKSAG
ncbi:hypothetical protein OIU85_018784 [Salix viminalis]|uniref:Uncharacterized protein n=1 Tax=Salix viminalis TaxID=40686 RepID=A0A9Q0UVR9_SALVM|nr:hypothetical protein OIU85_018784 [Salix viminalis]